MMIDILIALFAATLVGLMVRSLTRKDKSHCDGCPGCGGAACGHEK